MNKFKLTKEVKSAVPVYGGKEAITGDVIELDGLLAEKARNNPDFQEVKPGPKPKSSVNGD